MTGAAMALPPGGERSERLVWQGCACACAVVTAHLAAGWWLLPAARPLEVAAPPPAILIDLSQPSPEPAVATPPPFQSTAAPTPAPPQPVPVPTPQAAPVPDVPPPPETITPPDVVLPPRETAPAVTAEIVLPRPKPRPPERPRVEAPRPQPVREARPQPVPQSPPQPLAQSAPALPSAPAATALATPAAPAAAAPAAPSAASVAATKSWQGDVLARLARYKRYPVQARSDHEQGTAHLKFTVTRDGQVTAFSLAKSSGSSSLDEETLALIQRAQPLPPFPDDMANTSVELIVPVDFHLRG